MAISITRFLEPPPEFTFVIGSSPVKIKLFFQVLVSSTPPLGPGTATIHTFRDLVDQLVEIPLPFILYGLQLISGKRDTA